VTLPCARRRGYGRLMRRIALLAVTAATLLALAAPAGAVTVTNGTVTLGVNPQGDLNDTAAGIGLTYNATGNDSTISGLPAEGWGAGSAGAFVGVANEYVGNSGYATPVSFTSNATSAVSSVDILRGDTHALRLRQDFHPSPTTPNLYEITTTLTNLTSAPLADVRYERVMDWDIEPTATEEYVTINRGNPAPANLIYSDDNGFSDNNPFTFTAEGDPPLDDTTINASYVDKGPSDHGARFTFSFGTLAGGESKQFFLYYGAAGTEADANAAVSAAALEMFSYGQPSTTDGPTLGTPNTFIWGFRAVGGRPVIPPTLTLDPASGSAPAGGSTGVTATLRDSDGAPIPGAKLVFGVAGANSAGGAGTTDANGQVGFGYTGANAGGDTITACLDSNANGGCDAGEVAATATRSWDQQQVADDTDQSPQPVLGKSVVAGKVSGTVKFKRKNGKFRTLGANQSIPLGSTIDATKGRVRLTSASGPAGQIQTADFYQGAFVITQTGGTKPVTQLALAGTLRCGKKKSTKASVSAKKKAKKVRRLWGDGHGRFRTKGRHGAATVRGTKWLTEDRCDSTKVTVKRGTVVVRDFVKKKNVVVKKGHSYVARVRPKKK
jgi:hypothetical protein